MVRNFSQYDENTLDYSHDINDITYHLCNIYNNSNDINENCRNISDP